MLSKDRVRRVTASRAGAILGLSPFAKPDDVLREMVREHHGAEREFRGNVATDWGVEHEEAAINEYEFNSLPCVSFKLDNQQFLTFEDWLGCTPDGFITPGGMIEVKCPYSLRNGGRYKTLDEQPHYEIQIQVQMFVTDSDWCDFIQWSPVLPLYVERVERRNIAKEISQLKAFHERFKAELSNPIHLQPKRAEVSGEGAGELLAAYDLASEEIARLTKEKAEILSQIVEMSGGVDADICGRKLTKVERNGSIAYQKAIKELAPDADLEAYRGEGTEYWRLT
jgi:putative phage-type endonuclease